MSILIRNIFDTSLSVILLRTILVYRYSSDSGFYQYIGRIVENEGFILNPGFYLSDMKEEELNYFIDSLG